MKSLDHQGLIFSEALLVLKKDELLMARSGRKSGFNHKCTKELLDFQFRASALTFGLGFRATRKSSGLGSIGTWGKSSGQPKSWSNCISFNQILLATSQCNLQSLG